MTEEELIKEGFSKIEISKKESGDKTDYHYYIYAFDNGWQIISCANDEAINNCWNVRLENIDNVYITDMTEVIILINLIKSWLKYPKYG